MTSLGLYIHIPFCRKKCDYCSFYSVCELDKAEKYISALKNTVGSYGAQHPCFQVDSIYIGGGTPSVLGGAAIGEIIGEVRNCFAVTHDCEISCEANPDSADDVFLQGALNAGVNRLSLGVQSFCDGELEKLSRLHSARGAQDAVRRAKQAGFTNVNIDLMLDVPHSTLDTVKENVNRAVELGVTHLSAYCLKIEEGTPFFAQNVTVKDEDREFEMYEAVHNILEQKGYEHYEISGFAKPGYRCRHNLKYWKGRDYLGMGCAAHSFVGGVRFFETATVDEFSSGVSRIEKEDATDSVFENIMLALRTSDGLSFNALRDKLTEKEMADLIKCARQIEGYGYGKVTEDGFALNYKGMFISNTVILKLAESIGR